MSRSLDAKSETLNALHNVLTFRDSLPVWSSLRSLPHGSAEEGRDGKITRLRTMRSGTVVGELGFYLHRKASASVIADEPCTLFYLPAKKLEEMQKDAPEIASALHKFIAGILSERLTDTNDALQALIHSL